jgi:hypothetical protein
MNRLISYMLGLGLVLLGMAASAFGAMVVGSVTNSQGHPVSGVTISARETGGKVVGQAISDAKGSYSIDGLSPNTYDYILDPHATGFKGGNAVSYLDSNGLTIDWKVSNANDALALATQGTKPVLAGDPFGLSMGEFVSAVVLGTVGIGAAVAVGIGVSGGFSGSSSAHPPPKQLLHVTPAARRTAAVSHNPLDQRSACPPESFTGQRSACQGSLLAVIRFLT